MEIGQKVENVRQLVLQGLGSVRVVDRRYIRLNVLQRDSARQRSPDVLNHRFLEP